MRKIYKYILINVFYNNSTRLDSLLITNRVHQSKVSQAIVVIIAGGTDARKPKPCVVSARSQEPGSV